MKPHFDLVTVRSSSANSTELDMVGAHDAVLAAAAAALRARGQDQPASTMQAKLDLSQAHPAHTARTIRGMYRPK